MKLTKSLWLNTILAVITALLIPTIAYAHDGSHTSSGFLNGLDHPISGIDHILAMIAVGIIAYSIGGKAKFALPATFVSSMILGSIIGFSGVVVPGVESIILLSNLILGVILLLTIRLPNILNYSMVSLFAIFHGYAHGVEIPQDVNGITYIVGFGLATVMLHMVGIAIGNLSRKIDWNEQKLVLRASGMTIMIASIFLML